MIRIYRQSNDPTTEECFYLDLRRMPKGASRAVIEFLLDEPFTRLSGVSRFKRGEAEEIGPRVVMETSFSSTAVGILRPLKVNVARVERSMRFSRDAFPREQLYAEHLDLMTQEVYPRPLRTFDTGVVPAEPRRIMLADGGIEALLRESKEAGFAIDPHDAAYYLTIFERDPFDAELGLLGNANSDHSRHRTIGAPVTLNGVRQALTIMQMVKAPFLRDTRNSILGFKDGAGVIRGDYVEVLMPQRPGYSSGFVRKNVLLHITHTAETHNHPCYREPFEGAVTGGLGMLRDKWSQGRGALVVGVNGAGYCTGNPDIPGHTIPGADLVGEKSIYYASARDLLIGMSNGACDAANKIGEPIIFGFCRAFEQYVSGVRRSWTKPIGYFAGVSRVDDRHVSKRPIEAGMLIISMGNPARRVGVSGGAASSMEAGTNTAALDFASVQRGDPEEENRGNRVLRACAELGTDNPIIDLSDQGAGGPGNLFLELVGKLGGRIDVHKISCADPTMSALERLIAEFQERYGLVARKEDLPVLQAICKREDVVLDVIGEITGDGRFVVDSNDGTIVDLSIAAVLADLPVKELHWEHVPKKLEPLHIPMGLTVEQAFANVMSQVSVGSKGFLTRKGDRSVGGLVAQQQCCGPMQIPVADVAVMADSYYAATGSASALGEQPIVGLIDVKAGARKAVAEMITNIGAAHITGIPEIKCRLNEMWAAKQPGEGALLYEGVQAVMEAMEELDFFPDGGKDSLSMAAKDDRGETHVAPGQIVVFGTAPVRNVRSVLTPDFKSGGCIGFVDVGNGKRRLGGSAFAQSLGQLGNEAPDADIPLLNRAMKAQQQLLVDGLILAYHDISDGGLGVTVAEMCMAANCGANIRVGHDVFGDLFSEEVGYVFEYRHHDAIKIEAVMRAHNAPWREIGMAHSERRFTVRSNGRLLFGVTTEWLRRAWEKTSDALEMLQANPDTVRKEQESYGDNPVPFLLPAFPMPALSRRVTKKPRVAIIRARGSNGDREMAAACEMSDLEPVDIAMNDIFNKSITSLRAFEGAYFVGGFANADTFGSAKGWAASILFNNRVRSVLEDFYNRPDTFSLGVCNGCQLMALLGWLPDLTLPQASQPRLLHNTSRRFESRWSGVRVEKSPSIFLRGLEGSVLGINVSHGEGRFYFPDASVKTRIEMERLIPLVYVGPEGKTTERYPYNPNGSPGGIAALCSPDGRHMGMMPHPERCFLTQQMHHVPPDLNESGSIFSPWIRMFRNVHDR